MVRDLESLKRDMEGQDDDYLMWAEKDVAYMEKAIAWLDSLPDPEPLDPHTCELMVGDEVKYKGVNNIIVSITPKCSNAPTLYELIDRLPYNVFQGRYKSVLVMRRSKLKLTHRNGATIKEVDG